jgi:hypothetical protein
MSLGLDNCVLIFHRVAVRCEGEAKLESWDELVLRML